MSSFDRDTFLSLVKDSPAIEFANFILDQRKKQNKFDLKEVISSLPSSSLDDIWNTLQGYCTSYLLVALRSPDDEQIDQENSVSEKQINESRDILLAISEVAKETVLCKCMSAGLMQTAVVLNGVLINFPEHASKLKNSISQMCVAWIESKLDGYNVLGPQTMMFLMQKSLGTKNYKSFVKQVLALKDFLPELINDRNDNQEILDLLISIVKSDSFLSVPSGISLLSFLLCQESFTEKFHSIVKHNIYYCSKKQAATYGYIYFKAWQDIDDILKTKLETECIQDLMHHAVHVDRSDKSVANNLFAFLSSFHKESKNPKVSKLLYELYEPILWRALKVANGHVRCNSSVLFFDAFPLENPDMNNEDSEAVLQKHLQLVEELLEDECANVRTTSTYGTFSILYKHWGLLPATSIKSFLCKVSDLAFDGAAVECRLAVFKGFTKLLENPLSHPFLRVLLPKLQSGFHDPSEKVRLAFTNMLLMIKNLKSIKFWSIVPPNHLLARLAIENGPICKRIVSLIFNSYFPMSKTDSVRLERSIALIETNKIASRRFYQLMPKQTDLETIVHFMLLICKALKVYVRQKSSETCNSSALDNSAMNVSQEKENISNSDSFNLTESNDSSFPFNNTDIVSGLLDACTILWKEIYSSIYQRHNSTLLKSLHRSFTSAVPLFYVYFKDSLVMESLMYLSSLLPVKAVPMVSNNCMSKLRNMTDEQACGQPENYATLLESMCNWGKANLVLDTINEWLQEGLKNEPDKTDNLLKDNNSKRRKKGVLFSNPVPKQPHLAMEYLSFLLCHPVCKKILMESNRLGMSEILSSLEKILKIIEDYLLGYSVNISSTLIEDAFLQYMKLKVLLNDTESSNVIEELIVFWHRVIYPCMNYPSNELTTEKKKFRQFASKLSENLLAICINGIMVGAVTEATSQNIALFAIQVLDSDCGISHINQFGSFIQEFCEFCIKTDLEPKKAVTMVPVLVNKITEHYNKCLKKDYMEMNSEKLTQNISQVLKLLRMDINTKLIYKETMANVMTAIVAELTAYFEENEVEHCFSKVEEYPSLSSWIFKIISARAVSLRDFVEELRSCVDSGVIKSINGYFSISMIVNTMLSDFSDKNDVVKLKTIIDAIQRVLPSFNDNDENISLSKEKCTTLLESLTDKHFPASRSEESTS